MFWVGCCDRWLAGGCVLGRLVGCRSLLVRGGIDDQLTALGATQTAETRVIDGEVYDIYTLGTNGAYLVVDQDIDVVT